MFFADVEFDDETYLDANGEKKVPSRKHTYGFSEKQVKRLEP
jgi:hypothetical protein